MTPASKALTPLVALLLAASPLAILGAQGPADKAGDPTKAAAKEGEGAEKEKGAEKAEEATEIKVVRKTDAQWAKILTREQYLVTRLKETEPAFSGKYLNSHVKGNFDCVCCDTPLFASQAKFDSGTGWPSFWKPIDPKRIATAVDNTAAESRVEVMCRACGAHLGHVFEDGPPPTGLRFCINSVALKLVPAAGATAGKATAKVKGKASAKGKAKGAVEAEAKDKSAAPQD